MKSFDIYKRKYTHDFKVRVSGDDKNSYEASIAIHLCKSKLLLANTQKEIRFFDDIEYTEYKNHMLNVNRGKGNCHDPHCETDEVKK